jgi:hypothetical protein
MARPPWPIGEVAQQQPEPQQPLSQQPPAQQPPSKSLIIVVTPFSIYVVLEGWRTA